ncbi:hypothetical protein [Rhizobium sp. 007]|uniref:hypothetical protein n=1 Tax=Rhizobium sp. 007 TaxID=2785056 RepID=UPI001890ABFC|nr:hypothetical protein [Rhizobium sp. 007]QPB21168.1 hypothetical protein ISN39_06835 [Rhizobium sp. 007]
MIAPLQTLDNLSQRNLGLDIVDRLAEGLLHVRRKRVDEGGWPLFSVDALAYLLRSGSLILDDLPEADGFE